MMKARRCRLKFRLGHFYLNDMENKEELIEQAKEQIKGLAWHIKYHRKELDEYILKMKIAQFALTELKKK